MAMTTDFFSPVFTPYSACLFTQTEGKDKFAEKWRRVENIFQTDACAEPEADVPADPCGQPGIAQASLVDSDRYALVCGALWDWISGL